MIVTERGMIMAQKEKYGKRAIDEPLCATLV